MVEEHVIGALGYAFMGRAHSNGYNQCAALFPLKRKIVKRVICGRHQEQLTAMAQQFGWEETENDWHKMLARPDITVFDNLSPNDLHAEPCIAAAEAGKHIICEKPLARNVAEAEKMVAAVEKAGVKNMVAFNYRRVPAIALAKQLIEQGMLGKIYHFRAVYLQDWIRDPNFPLVWRLRKETAGSGPHGDLNAHIIDIAQFLVGNIERVNGLAMNFIKKRKLPAESKAESGLKSMKGSEKMGEVTVEDAMAILAKIKGGIMGTFEATRFATGRRNHNCIEVNGSKGALWWDLERMDELHFYTDEDPKFARGFRTILVTEAEHPYISNYWPAGHIIGWGETFTNEIYDFLKSIEDDTKPSPSFREGLQNQKVLEAVVKSAETEQWENVD